MLDTGIPRPAGARSFTTRRRVRLSDMDVAGRVRLDALARFLQDAAIDDVQETGWGVPDHLWVVRAIQIDVVSPLLRDRSLELTTWCSGVAAIAAGRRWSVVGDAGGRIEVDSVWIHLGPDQRPARIGDSAPTRSLRRVGRSQRSSRSRIRPPARGAPGGRSALRTSTPTDTSTTPFTGRRSRTRSCGTGTARPPAARGSTTATRPISTMWSSSCAGRTGRRGGSSPWWPAAA